MTRDEAREILGEGATEEQITNLLNKMHLNNSSKVKNLEQQVNELKEQNEKYNEKYSDYDSLRKKLDDIEKEKMTEQERIEADKKATAENLYKSKIMLNTTTAKQILADYDLSDEEISALVRDDMDTTLSIVNKFKERFDNYREKVEKKTREDLTNLDLKPSITNVNQNEDVMTFDKFSKLSASEQEKFINEHPDEFEKL